MTLAPKYVSVTAYSVSPKSKKSDGFENMDIKPTNMFGGGRTFKDMFDEAMKGGVVEVRVMLVAEEFAPESFP